MRFTKPVAAVAAAAAISAPALAQDTSAEIESTLRLVQRLATQYAILISRSFVDLTYDSIAVEAGTNDLVISGLRIYPDLAWDEDGQCEIDVDRAVFANTDSFEMPGSNIEVSGISIPRACFQPPVAQTLAGFGYDGLTVDSAAIEMVYDLPSSSADLNVQAAIADAADIDLTAHFDYLWFRFPDAGDTDRPPEPVARLGSAEFVVQNNGLWQRLEPMLTDQLGDLQAIPQMAEMTLGQMFSNGGTAALTTEEQAFVDNIKTELARFIEQKNRIVLTVTPEGGSVLLTPDLFETPGTLLAALDPVVSATPRAWREVVAPADLSAALAGGGNLDAATRLRVGRALITGIGAPRSPETGRTLLAPLAKQWNPEAALLAAGAAQEAGDDQAAYAMALRAMAGGQTEAIALADDIEADLPLVSVLGIQSDAAAAWPGAGDAKARADVLVKQADIAGMRKLAYALSTGTGRPRNYGQAYYWASLAAAGGDRGAASLRKRLDERFAERDGWRDTASAAASKALETWTTGGLAQAIAARVQ